MKKIAFLICFILAFGFSFFQNGVEITAANNLTLKSSMTMAVAQSESGGGCSGYCTFDSFSVCKWYGSCGCGCLGTPVIWT